LKEIFVLYHSRLIDVQSPVKVQPAIHHADPGTEDAGRFTSSLQWILLWALLAFGTYEYVGAAVDRQLMQVQQAESECMQSPEAACETQSALQMPDSEEKTRQLRVALAKLTEQMRALKMKYAN
jgi:hypothetical protein